MLFVGLRIERIVQAVSMCMSRGSAKLSLVGYPVASCDRRTQEPFSQITKMFSLRRISSRLPRAQFSKQCLRLTTTRPLSLLLSSTRTLPSQCSQPILAFPPNASRTFATTPPADTLIEAITEQYAVAQDEFEYASHPPVHPITTKNKANTVEG